MIGWRVGPVCELDFEILPEGDGIHSEGKCQSLHEPLSEFLTWMKGNHCPLSYPSWEPGLYLQILSLLHPSIQPRSSQGCLYNSCRPLAREVLQSAGYKVALCSQRDLVESWLFLFWPYQCEQVTYTLCFICLVWKRR